MTTHRHAVEILGRSHRRGKLIGAALAVVGSVLCALAMIGNVTWAEETNWFWFGFAGFGVVGFGLWAVDLWREWPKGGEPAWTHWYGATFWAAFGLYQVFGLIYGLWITNADTNWFGVAIAPILAVVMFWWAYQEGRKALAR